GMPMTARRTVIETANRSAGQQHRTKWGGVAGLVLPLLLAVGGGGGVALAREGGAKGTQEPLLTLRGHQNRIFGIRFSPDGNFLVAARGDRRIKVWDSASGKLAYTLEGHTAMVYALAFSPDGKRLASVSGGWGEDPNVQGEVIVWDLATRRKAITLKGHKG